MEMEERNSEEIICILDIHEGGEQLSVKLELYMFHFLVLVLPVNRYSWDAGKVGSEYSSWFR